MHHFPFFKRDADTGTCSYLATPSKVVFHHIPKTAGSTFRAFLESLYGPGEACPAETVAELEALTDDELGRYKLYAGHFSFGSLMKCLPDAIWITFLREPNERVISQYYNHADESRVPAHWNRRISESPKWSAYMNGIRGNTLEEWISNPLAEALVCNRQVQAFLPNSIRVRVKDWSKHDRQLLEIAKDNLRTKFAFYGIQEQFSESLLLFCATFGLLPLEDYGAYTTNLNENRHEKSSESGRYPVSEVVTHELDRKNSMDWELYRFAGQLFAERVEGVSDLDLEEHRQTQLTGALVRGLLKPLPRGVTRISVDGDLGLKGFHALEMSGETPFRWSGADKTSTIEFLRELDGVITISVEVLAYMSVEQQLGISVLLDGVSANHQLVPAEGMWRLVVEVPRKSWTGTYHKLVLSVPGVPERSDGRGARLLGLAVSRVAFEGEGLCSTD